MNKDLEQKLISAGWLDKLEKFFFALFLLSIPLQARLVFLTAETYLFGTFNEYGTFYLYLSDIFLLITFLLYFVKKINESRYFKENLTKIRIISIVRHKLSTSPQVIPIFLLLLLISWLSISVLWSSYHEIAVYRSFKLLEFILLYLYISKRLYSFGVQLFFALIFLIGVFESIIGILQYFLQHSLGLKLLGESVLNPNIDNVAKIIVNGGSVIRAYGTFPHPNIFSAFLILSIFSGLWLLLLNNKPEAVQIVSRVPFKASSGEKIADLKQNEQIVSRETILNTAAEGETIYTRLSGFLTKLFNMRPSELSWFKKWYFQSKLYKLFHVKQFIQKKAIFWLFLLTFGIILQLIAFVLTFSRAAWFGFGLIVVILLFYLFSYIKIISHAPFKASFGEKITDLKQNEQIVSRETILNTASEGETIYTRLSGFLLKLFHVKQFDLERKRVKQFISNSLNKGQKIALLLIMFIILVIAVFQARQIYNRIIDNEQRYLQAFDSRVLYNDISLNIINKNLLLGVGSGNFTLIMNGYSPTVLDWWQYQPVHNIYLLIASELGVVGLLIFILFVLVSICNIQNKYNNQIVSCVPFKASSGEKIADLKQNEQIVSRETILNTAAEGETIYTRLSGFLTKLFNMRPSELSWFKKWYFQSKLYKLFHVKQFDPERRGVKQFNALFTDEPDLIVRNVSVGRYNMILLKSIFFSILLVFLFMGLFDHYFWSFQQGQIILWLVLGLSAAINNPE